MFPVTLMTHPHLLYHDMIEKSIDKFNKYLDIKLYNMLIDIFLISWYNCTEFLLSRYYFLDTTKKFTAFIICFATKNSGLL